MARESRENVEAFEAAHKHFHMALLAGCNLPILLKFCSQLYDLNIRYRYLAGKSLNYRKRDIAAEHAASSTPRSDGTRIWRRNVCRTTTA